MAHHVEEVIKKHKHATPNAVPRIVNGISGQLGHRVPRHVVVGPNNALVPFSSMRLVVEHHALGLGQNRKIVTPKLVLQVSCMIVALGFTTFANTNSQQVRRFNTLF